MNTKQDQIYQQKINQELGNSLKYPDRYQYRQFDFIEEEQDQRNELIRGLQSLNVNQELCSVEARSAPLSSTPRPRSRYLQLDPFYETSTNEIMQFPPNYSGNQLPPLPFSSSSTRSLRFIVVSDTHDRHNLLQTLPPCDVLIHAGDILMKGRKASRDYAIQKYQQFNDWLGQQPAKHKIVIGGNHDYHLEKLSKEFIQRELFSNAHYLCNDYIEIEGCRIFGSPISTGTSENAAFQSHDFLKQCLLNLESCKKSGIDVLITHSAVEELLQSICPQMMYVFGHVHEYYGVHLWPTTRRNPSSIVPSEEPRQADERVTVLMESWFTPSQKHLLLPGNVPTVPLIVVNSAIMDGYYQLSQSPTIIDCVIRSELR